jgi:hypothetical protein
MFKILADLFPPLADFKQLNVTNIAKIKRSLNKSKKTLLWKSTLKLFFRASLLGDKMSSRHKESDFVQML